MPKTLLTAAALVLACAFALTVAVDAGQRPAAPAGQHVHGGAPATRVVPMKPHTGPLPALPRVSYEPPRPMAVIQQVYEFAARHPEVLQYVPCYCGCERSGHNGNHDCFVRSRAADGRVTAFDAHGIGCTICIDVARDAMTMFNAGTAPKAIRAAIDKKYAGRFPSATPTPMPR